MTSASPRDLAGVDIVKRIDFLAGGINAAGQATLSQGLVGIYREERYDSVQRRGAEGSGEERNGAERSGAWSGAEQSGAERSGVERSVLLAQQLSVRGWLA